MTIGEQSWPNNNDSRANRLTITMISASSGVYLHYYPSKTRNSAFAYSGCSIRGDATDNVLKIELFPTKVPL